MDKYPYGRPTDTEIEMQSITICGSPRFSNNEQPTQLFRYLINLVLNPPNETGAEDLFSAESISYRLFPPDRRKVTHPIGNPKEQDKASAVRQIARNLRIRLDEYYHGAGQRDTLVIDIPLGRYRPACYFRAVADEPLDPEETRLLLKFRLLLEYSVQNSWKHKGEQTTEVLLQLLKRNKTNPLLLNSLVLWLLFGLLLGEEHRATLRRLQNVLEMCKTEKISSWQLTYMKGCISAFCFHDWKDADRYFNLAIQASDGIARDLPYYDQFLIAQHRFDEALSMGKRRCEEYGYISGTRNYAHLLVLAGCFQEAESVFLELIDIDRCDVSSHVGLMTIYIATSRFEEISKHLDIVEYESPSHHFYFSSYVGDPRLLAYYLEKRREHLAWQGGKANEMTRSVWEVPPIPYFDLANGAHAVNDRQDCLYWLSGMAMVHEPPSIILNVHPAFRTLHSDPSFREMIALLNLPLD